MIHGIHRDGSTANVSGFPASGHFWWEAIFPSQRFRSTKATTVEFRNVLRCILHASMHQKRFGDDITATGRCVTSRTRVGSCFRRRGARTSRKFAPTIAAGLLGCSWLRNARWFLLPPDSRWNSG